MSTETITILITTTSLAVVLLICAWLIRRALKRETISYSGNRPGMPTRTYSRTESRFRVRVGVGVIIFVVVFAVPVAAMFMPAAFGTDI